MINASLYDIDAISEDLGIDIEDMVEIFRVYFIEISELILNLRYLFEKEEWDKLKKINHNIKGISSNLKIHDIYNTALNFDSLIDTRNADEIYSCIVRLEKMSAHSKIEIRDFFINYGLEI